MEKKHELVQHKTLTKQTALTSRKMTEAQKFKKRQLME